MRAIDATAAAIFLAGACTPAFPEPSLVQDLRVLAIRADPPEVMLTPESLQNPPAITLTTLVVDPRPGRPAPMQSAVACPGPPAAPPQDALTAVEGVTAAPRAVLCPPDAIPLAAPVAGTSADEAVFTFQPTADLLQAALDSDPLSGMFGAALTFQLAVDEGDGAVLATKTVPFTLPLVDGQVANQNPVIDSIATVAAPPQPLSATSAFQIAADQYVGLEAQVGTREAFPELVFDPSRQQYTVVQVASEALLFDFFSVRGVFSPGERATAQNPEYTGGMRRIESYYRIQGWPSGTRDPIWIVVRDDRGGVSWGARTIVVE